MRPQTQPRLVLGAKAFAAAAAMILISLFAGCYRAGEIPVGTEIPLTRETFSFGQQEHPYDLFTSYHIVPGDVLDLLFQMRTWTRRQEFKLSVGDTVVVKFVTAPELNETQRVRPDGNITMPYLGDVAVAGKTPAEVTSELKRGYGKILQVPNLHVTTPEFDSNIKELKADLHTAPRGLSRLITVRPDGYATFPMLGDIFVANRTFPDVAQQLNEIYEETLPGLHCDLFLEKHAGSSIYIVGEVNKPGVYEISRPITVLEALAQCGSYLPSAKLNSIFVVRKHDSKLVATRVDLAHSLSFISDSKLFYLQPSDIVYVPKTELARAAEIARDLANVLFFKGWGLGLSWELHDATNNSSNSTF